MVLLIGAVVWWSWAACSVERRNLSACEDWIATLDCGRLDPAALGFDDYYCDDLSAQPCDLSAYFDCLADDSTCVGEGPAAVYTLAQCSLPAYPDC